ncbi:MAG: DUF885 domain-containing protein [Anaeroplasmataceae bacterium]|nr:DUF885 domain-containing protein [Anaeroplasmataceae bacterium]
MSKSFKKLLLCILCAFSLSFVTVTLVSCTNNDKTAVTPEELFPKLSLNDVEIDYDGEAHRIEIEGELPEEAKVEYTGNDKTAPGEYHIVARVTYKGKSKNYYATLMINKLTSTLSALETQVKYVSDESTMPAYEITHSDQPVQMKVKRNGILVESNVISRAGVYEIELYAEATSIYKESNHVMVQLTVKESQFEGVSFKDQVFLADQEEHTMVIEGTLPAGYSVEYENNTASSVGTYFAVAKIKDTAGEIVETHRAVMKIENKDDEAFETYLNEFFVMYLEGDQLSVNIICENPADFGLERYDAVWYTYKRDTNSSSTDAVKEFDTLLDELHQYDIASLSERQALAYRQLDSFLSYQKNYNSFKDIDFMENHYIDQFGGYVADFGTYMEAYTLREKADVEDIVNYILSTETAFSSYIDYLEDKTQAGYPLSNYTLQAMINYLNDILLSLDGGKTYYLNDILARKVDATDFLTIDEKTEFKSRIKTALDNEFVRGIRFLTEQLPTFIKDAASEEGYWAIYEQGKELFELELKNLLGISDLDMEEYIRELDYNYEYTSSKALEAFSTIQSKYKIDSYAKLNQLFEECTIFDGTPEEMLEYLNEFAKTIVPELKNKPMITVKNMDEASAKVSNAVAYYMKSALDNETQEFITLNPLKLGDKNDVLGTLSHEGYPGHLYAYCYSKELDLHNLSKIMTSTAHGEGWATYVELKLYETAKNNSNSQKFKDVMDYCYYNQLSSFLLETRIDVGIHYEGWSIADIRDFLGSNYTLEDARDIYRLLIETPVTYAAYGYGKYFFYNLHVQGKKALGKYYDEVEFNQMLLSKGWTSLGELQDTYDQYILEKKHIYGIQ